MKLKTATLLAIFGAAGMEWERMDDKRMSRIKFELPEVSVFHEEDWDRMIQFMSGVVPKFEVAFKKPISQLSRR